VTWALQDGVITVTTAADLKTTVTKVFDVRDLVRAMRSESQQHHEEPITWFEIEDKLIVIITEHIDPESWRDAGGSVGTVRAAAAGRFVVTQTRDNMRQVERLLAELSAPAQLATLPAGDGANRGPTRVYDVRDLLSAFRKARPQSVPEDDLVLLITDHIAPDSWRDAGGSDGLVHLAAGRLIVRHRDDAHRQVERFLAELRDELATP
jgi:hypothetical protein